MKPIEPIGWANLNRHLSGMQMEQAIQEAVETIVKKVDELVEGYNGLRQKYVLDETARRLKRPGGTPRYPKVQ